MNTRTLNVAWIVCLAVALASGCTEDDDHPRLPTGGEEAHDDHGHDEAAHADEVTLSPEAIQRWDIRVEKVGRHTLVATVDAPARVAFNAEAIAHVGSLVPGRVSEIAVRAGDSVARGDPVLVIQSPQWGQAQSDYLHALRLIEPRRSAVAVARELHDRGRSLYESSRGIALTEVQAREAALRAAETDLAIAEGDLESAANTLRLLGMDAAAIASLAETGRVDPRYTLRSPIDGRVIERAVALGESVGPDRDALLVIADVTTLWVIADAPEARIAQIVIGAPAKVTTPGDGGRPIDGTVAYIGPQANPSTRTVSVRIETAARDDLRPGMFTQVHIALGDSAATPAIPASAIQIIDGWPCVFVPVEGEANTFAKRVVRVGRRVGDMAPVLDGLREGDAFVAHGSFILKADLGKAGAAHEH